MEPGKFFLRGEVDLANAADLVATLRSVARRQSGDLVVDCMDLTFIDASGVRAMLQVQAELAQDGRDLWLAHPSPFFARILKVLDLTGLIQPQSAEAEVNVDSN
jgi:anti-sigma B factor antagonist